MRGGGGGGGRGGVVRALPVTRRSFLVHLRGQLLAKLSLVFKCQIQSIKNQKRNYYQLAHRFTGVYIPRNHSPAKKCVQSATVNGRQLTIFPSRNEPLLIRTYFPPNGGIHTNHIFPFLAVNIPVRTICQLSISNFSLSRKRLAFHLFISVNSSVFSYLSCYLALFIAVVVW